MKYEANFTDNCHQDSNNALDKKSLFNWNKNKTNKEFPVIHTCIFPFGFHDFLRGCKHILYCGILLS